MTVRQLAAELYGHGTASAGAEQDFWNALPALAPEEVEAIVRRISPADQFGIISHALNGTPERTAALKARFTAAEIQAMVQAR
jgi:hypothetical protein